MWLIAILALMSAAPQPLHSGNHNRTLVVDQVKRTYLVHVPPQYDARKATPVVLILHGAGTDAAITVKFTGMNQKADEAGFIAVYPNGTGYGPIQTWNAGGVQSELVAGKADDVAFISRLIDDLGQVINVDSRRVYATGMSNGGMMCYKLAAELPDRIAAIAPVAGTMTMPRINPTRPVPVMHFHGTDDDLCPFNGPSPLTPKFITFQSVDATINAWVQANGCPNQPAIVAEPVQIADGTSVLRATYGPGKLGSEVVLFTIQGGGHTWPGQPPPVRFIGKSTLNLSANDQMWEFFKKHPRPAP